MNEIQAMILGLIQGLTEFLPISSSAHLGMIPYIFGWKEQLLSFDITLHIASLFALIIYFKKDIKGLLKGLFNDKDKTVQSSSKSFFVNILISLTPLLPFYLVFKSLINQNQTFSSTTLLLLIIFGILLIIADRIGRKNQMNLNELKPIPALLIGAGQSLALFSGVSRSGITITAALLIGLKIEDAKKYSFLLSIPTILLGFIFELRNNVLPDLNIQFILGVVTSFISAYFALFILFKLGEKIKLEYYGYYRILLGIILLILLF